MSINLHDACSGTSVAAKITVVVVIQEISYSKAFSKEYMQAKNFPRSTDRPARLSLGSFRNVSERRLCYLYNVPRYSESRSVSY